MFSKLSMLAMAGAASVTALGAAAQAQQNPPGPGVIPPGQSQTCAFNSGPRAGQIIDYSAAPGSGSVPIGSPCADMHGSTGQAVAQPSGPPREGQARQYSYRGYYRSEGAPNAWDSSGNLSQGFSLTCRLTSGPRAGATVDFSHTLGAQPVAIGAPCAADSSWGVAVNPGM